METDNKILGLITMLGAMAETLGSFRKELICNGFSEQDALELCKAFMDRLLTKGDNDSE